MSAAAKYTWFFVSVAYDDKDLGKARRRGKTCKTARYVFVSLSMT